MRKAFFKLPLTLLACPLLSVMAISGHALGTKETDNQKLTAPQEWEQSERQIGRLWLMAMPHFTSEEKGIVTQYLQAGIRRDYDNYKSIKMSLEQLVEEINAADVVEGYQARQELLVSILPAQELAIKKKETK